MFGDGCINSFYFTSDEEKAATQNKAGEAGETKAKGTRQSYVHKPYLYSKYYSDSDDELTVEQRRQSVVRLCFF